MPTTNHLALTLLEASQAQKEVTMNEALARIDALMNTGALSFALTAPPGSPDEGDLYVVAAAPTGDWDGHAGEIAYFDGGIWRFVAPLEGMALWHCGEDQFYHYSGAAWVAETARIRGFQAVQYQLLQALTDAAGIDWNLATQPVASVTLGGNRTLNNPTNAHAGADYVLVVKQDGTGGRTLGFGVDYAFTGGTAPTLTSAANHTDLLRFVYDGSKMLGQFIADVR